MNWQQKLWKVITTFFYASGPWLLYALLPSFAMTVGMALRHIVVIKDYIYQSGNFYLFIGSLIVLWILKRRSRKRNTTVMEEATLFLESPDIRYGARCVLFGASFAVLISAILTLVPFPDWLMKGYTESSSQIFVRTDFILSLLVIGITSPLLEELVFRGYMINRLMTYFNEKQAVWISAVVFGFVHVQPLWVLYATLFGYILGAVSVKKDNILYAVCIHMGFNFPSLVNAVILRTGKGGSFFFQSPVLIAVYGVIAGGIVCLLYRQYKTEEMI